MQLIASQKSGLKRCSKIINTNRFFNNGGKKGLKVVESGKILIIFEPIQTKATNDKPYRRI